MHACVGIYTEFERLRNDAAREWDMFEQGEAMLEAPQKQQPSGSEAARSTSLPERSHTSASQAMFGGDALRGRTFLPRAFPGFPSTFPGHFPRGLSQTFPGPFPTLSWSYGKVFPRAVGKQWESIGK